MEVGRRMLSQLWRSFTGLRICSGMWAYFSARDRNRIQRELNKQHDEGTQAIAKEIENGGVVYETQPGRTRFVYRPISAGTEPPEAGTDAMPTDIPDVRMIADFLARGQLDRQLGPAALREQENL